MGGGLPRERVGPKSLACPSNPKENKLFGGMCWDFGWDIPAVLEKLEEEVFVFNLLPPNLENNMLSQGVSDSVCRGFPKRGFYEGGNSQCRARTGYNN